MHMEKLLDQLTWPKASQNQSFKGSLSFLMVKIKKRCRATADQKGKDQRFSGVTVWPGFFVCCWASPLSCWRQRWGQSKTSVGGATFSGFNMHPLSQLEISLYFRFSGGETLLWTQSLFFSLASCIFLVQPAVVYLFFFFCLIVFLEITVRAIDSTLQVQSSELQLTSNQTA